LIEFFVAFVTAFYISYYIVNNLMFKVDYAEEENYNEKEKHRK
tara:strand:+ start:1035 stop:1163 length:129 start_codon:yes stop_codon:yes gene_type:complete